MTVKYILRDLPGVAEVEAILIECQLHKTPLWAPRRDAAVELAEKASARLFGISAKDTRDAPPYGTKPREAREYIQMQEDIFDGWFTDGDRRDPELIDLWAEHGWDVTGSDGAVLYALELFGRQILTGIAGGCRLPDEAPTEQELGQQADDWAAKLVADAAKFKRGK